MRARTDQALDLLALDHMSTCPSCLDLWPLYRVRCDCGERLLPRNVKAAPRPAVAHLSPRIFPWVAR